MARPLIAPLAPGISMHSGYIARLIAVNATTGNPVNGVVVSSVSMQVFADDPETDVPEVFVPPVFAYAPPEGGG